MRYTPKTPNDVRACLGDCPDVTPVDIEPGVPVTAQTVAELSRAFHLCRPVIGS